MFGLKTHRALGVGSTSRQQPVGDEYSWIPARVIEIRQHQHSAWIVLLLLMYLVVSAETRSVSS